MVDLWAEGIGVSKLRPPVIILKEQASLLGQKTNYIVTAEVKSSVVSSNKIRHDLFIVAPTLDNYTFNLFSISHDSIELYPVFFSLDRAMMLDIYGDIKSETIKSDIEDDYIAMLEKILKSNRSKRVVQSLLAQSSNYVLKDDEDIPF